MPICLVADVADNGSSFSVSIIRCLSAKADLLRRMQQREQPLQGSTGGLYASFFEYLLLATCYTSEFQPFYGLRMVSMEEVDDPNNVC